VLVDAIVSGKNGAYVRDLTAKDFRVWEDNKPQVLQSVTFESAESRSVLVLFVDETSMDVRDQIGVRQAASAFIEAETGPNRKMAVVSYDGRLRVAQNFTDNAGRLKDALPKPRASGVEKSDYGSGIPVRENSVEVVGARNMIAALGNLGENLGTLPGRKIVVLFAGRLSSSASQRSDMSRAIEECNRSESRSIRWMYGPSWFRLNPSPSGRVPECWARHQTCMDPVLILRTRAPTTSRFFLD
jgi:VWFA-related protein